MTLFSRKSIDNLGKRFRDNTSVLKDKILFHDYRIFRSEDFIDNFLKITQIFEGHNTVISGRLKRIDTVIRKLRRERKMDLSFMNDICGYRVIVPSRSIQSNFLEVLQKEFSVKKIHNYVDSPKQSGYQGIHIICHVPKFFANKDSPTQLTMEIQLRTFFQHVWSTRSESFGENVKVGNDNELNTNNLLEESVMIRDFELENHNYNQIEIPKSISKMTFNVINYDKKRKIKVTEDFFSDKQFDKALEYYKWLENNLSQNLKNEVVLIAGTDHSNFNKSHLRYFSPRGKPALPKILKQ